MAMPLEHTQAHGPQKQPLHWEALTHGTSDMPDCHNDCRY